MPKGSSAPVVGPGPSAAGYEPNTDPKASTSKAPSVAEANKKSGT